MACSLPTANDLPPIDRLALLLDIDGTLLDFASTPDGVIIPPDLPGCLRDLRGLFGGALGFITGRSVAQVDAMLPDIATAVACEHGAVVRHDMNAEVVRYAPSEYPTDWLEAAETYVARYEGAVLEKKSAGFVLHYRRTPALENEFHAFLQKLIAGNPDYCVLPSKMAWEMKAHGVDKGHGLLHLMQKVPFAGKLPVFIGDDVTDLDAINAANEMGGCGYLVKDAFGSPEDVRQWLSQLPSMMKADPR